MKRTNKIKISDKCDDLKSEFIGPSLLLLQAKILNVKLTFVKVYSVRIKQSPLNERIHSLGLSTLVR